MSLGESTESMNKNLREVGGKRLTFGMKGMTEINCPWGFN